MFQYNVCNHHKHSNLNKLQLILLVFKLIVLLWFHRYVYCFPWKNVFLIVFQKVLEKIFKNHVIQRVYLFNGVYLIFINEIQFFQNFLQSMYKFYRIKFQSKFFQTHVRFHFLKVLKVPAFHLLSLIPFYHLNIYYSFCSHYLIEHQISFYHEFLIKQIRIIHFHQISNREYFHL